MFYHPGFIPCADILVVSEERKRLTRGNKHINLTKKKPSIIHYWDALKLRKRHHKELSWAVAIKKQNTNYLNDKCVQYLQ
jgi:hypothetical protein